MYDDMSVKKLGEPSLDPPEMPDADECAECGAELGDEVYEVELPRPSRFGSQICVCSPECAGAYVQGWADYQYESWEDSQWVN